MRNKRALIALVSVLGIAAFIAGDVATVYAANWQPITKAKIKTLRVTGPATLAGTTDLTGTWKIDGTEVTPSASELNVLDGATSGTAVASKALVLGASKNTDTIKIDNFIQFLAHDTEPGTTEGMLYADNSDNKLKYYNGSSWVNLVTGGGSGDNTLDLAYDEGGAGAGRAIVVDSGAVTLTVTDGSSNAALEITQNDTTNDPNALTITSAVDLADAPALDIDAQTTGRDIEGTGASWYTTGLGQGWFTTFISPSIASATGGNVALAIDAAGSGVIRLGQTSTGLVQVDRRFDALGIVNLGDAAGDAVSIVGSIVADVTLDDGVTDSPSLIFQDATNETATFVKTDAGRLGLTTDASDGLNVLTGNLWVGNGAPGTAAMDGEDLYVEGEAEFDSTVQFDGAVTFASSTTFSAAVASTIVTMSTSTDEGNTFARNQATTTSDLVTITVTNPSDDEQALFIDFDATAAVDAMQIENAGTGASLHITGEAAGSVALDIDVAASATARILYGDLGTWLGTSGEGAIELVSDSAGQVAAGTMLRLQQQGTGQHTAAIDGSVLYIEDDATAPAVGTSYAVNIDAALIEALHVDGGESLFDEVAHFTSGIDADSDVDVDFDVNTESVDITTSVTDYGADSAVMTIYASGAGQTNDAYLLRLRHAANADANDHFLVAEDNDGDVMFKVDANGELTAAGAATFSSTLDVGVGDFQLSSVAVTADAAELNLTDGLTATTAQLSTITVDPGAHGMGSVDFNAVGTGAMTITINGVAYLEAGSEDFANGVWTNGASASDSATSLISAINGDARASVEYTALADESTGGLVIMADNVGTGGNFSLASDDGSATVSAGNMTGGAAAAIKRQATYEHTVNTNDALLENVDIPLPFAPVGFTLQVRSSTGLYKAITDLVTIETSPNRIRIDKDGGTNLANTDVINVLAWN